MGVDNKKCNALLALKYGKKCMLTGRKDFNTYHHIEKACEGGRATIENGGRLHDKIHQWVHIIENIDPELYDLVNECIILYKLCVDRNEKELLKQYNEEVVPEYNKILERRYKHGR